VLGSCFAFRAQTAFVTAAHCVGDRAAGDLTILTPGFGARGVTAVRSHPTADLALLVVEPAANDPTQPFAGHLRRATLGADVTVYGYPEDVFGAAQGQPVPRVLRSHVQRFMPYESHMGFRYEAAELSIAAPPGVSGAPVLMGDRVVGVAAESQLSTTVLESIETVTRGGVPMRTVYERVIEYGVSVHLYDVRDWLRGLF
jgi:hypothetical protein